MYGASCYMTEERESIEQNTFKSTVDELLL